MEKYRYLPARYQITSILRKAILSGEFEKGEELSLTEIAAQMGVSRTPVREAFQSLEAEGLLQLRMNKGAIVCGIDRKFILDHFEMRILLEGEAAYLAALHRPSMTEISKLCDRTLVQLEKNDYSECVGANQAIHTFLWTAADNQKLFQFLSTLWNGPSIGKTTDDREHHRLSALEHRRILDYVECGNADQAKLAMQEHIRRSMDNILCDF